MYPDAGGTRPAMRIIATRLASSGYAVLLPDVYYRHGNWTPFSMDTVFTLDSERQRLFQMIGSLKADMSVRDCGAFLHFLATHPDVKTGPVGTTGYCMGGRISLIVAGHHPDRIGAAASFHGGRLAISTPAMRRTRCRRDSQLRRCLAQAGRSHGDATGARVVRSLCGLTEGPPELPCGHPQTHWWSHNPCA